MYRNHIKVTHYAGAFCAFSWGPRSVLSELTEQGSIAERNLHALLKQMPSGHLNIKMESRGGVTSFTQRIRKARLEPKRAITTLLFLISGICTTGSFQ